MNKQKSGQELIRLLNRRFTEGSITQQEAQLYVGQAANKYIRDYLWALQKQGEYVIPASFLREYTEEAKLDSNREEWYVDLPVRTLDSIGYNRGVYHVYKQYNEDDLFVPTNTGFLGMFSGLDSFELEGRLSYRQIGNRIYINGTNVGTGYMLSMNLLVDNNELAPDEELTLPPDAEEEVMHLALQLVKIKMGLPPDLIVDNTDK